MRKSIFKSKIVTGAMALMLTVSMMPGMAVAESMENAENDSMVAEEVVQDAGIAAEANYVDGEAVPNIAVEDVEMVQSRTANLSVVDPVNVARILVGGANVVSHTVSTVNSNNGNSGNKTYTYNIVLQQGTPPNAQVTATFTKAANSQCTISRLPRISPGPYPTIPAVLANASLVYPINLLAGEGTANAYLFPNIGENFTRFDTYKFVYTIEQTQSVGISFGDPQFPPTPPESDMVLGGTYPNYIAQYNGNIQGYYPDILTVRIEGNTSLTTENGITDKVCFVEYDPNGVPTELATPTNQTANIHTIKIKQEGRIKINDSIYLKFNNPQSVGPVGSGFPTMFKGYLPMGQFATGSAWGSPYSDGNTQAGTVPKIVAGEGGGMSLGAAGGYAEYDMAVENSNTNKYGVDFIVYGNAFNGNPEAGSVKVYGTPSGSNTAGWYELAGSRYYQDETLRNVNVSYKNYAGTLRYKVTKGDVANPSQVLKDWTPFGGSINWLPTAEKYNRVKGNVDDVIANLDAGEVTYGGVTLVRDTDTNADYAFGYFDVASNGTGDTPVNPYLSSNVGANGFDISWAVDENGEPVNLPSISKIRVYTSAALNIDTPDANDFTAPSIFGETSAELTGIVKAGGQQSTPVGVTDNAAIEVFSPLSERYENIEYLTEQVENISESIKMYTLSVGDFWGLFDVRVIAGNSDNVYINEVFRTSAELEIDEAQGRVVRVVVQNGDKEPRITLIKIQP